MKTIPIRMLTIGDWHHPSWQVVTNRHPPSVQCARGESRRSFFRDVILWDEFNGRVSAVQTVEVRPRKAKTQGIALTDLFDSSDQSKSIISINSFSFFIF